MWLSQIIEKINHKVLLKCIHIWCFHHVSSSYDSTYMLPEDWICIDDFKEFVSSLIYNNYRFISLFEAFSMLKNDSIRLKKYAVITFDDGYYSLTEILPWLIDNHIPTTLFINGKYLDGKSYRNNPYEKYLSMRELFNIDSPFVEIGHHGWEHKDCTKMTTDEFTVSLEQNIKMLSTHPRYIPFWAYTWGKHNVETDNILRNHNLIPVIMDGNSNYNDRKFIHREILKHDSCPHNSILL